jgi:hypothetical protein
MTIPSRAARRTRQSVQPPGGRREGRATAIVENYLPGVANQMLTLPQRAFDAAERLGLTGEYDPGPALEAATLMVGSPLMPRGALGSSARRSPRLPMDEASGMARADAMGFRRNTPVEYGTAPAGEKIAAAAFNVNGRIFTAPMHYEALESAEQARRALLANAARPDPGGFRHERRPLREPRGGRGHRTTSPSSWGVGAVRPRACVTQRFSASETAASGTQASQGAAIPPGPIWHRSERSMSIDARGAAEGEIQASLKKAWNQGHDAVMLRNYTSPGGRSGDILVVKDPAQLRSANAKFDPAKRNSNDLSASIAALLGPGVTVHALGEATPQANDEAFWDAWRRGDAL